MSLYTEFMAAVDHAATEQRCARGFPHDPHTTTTGDCPGRPTPHTYDQTHALANLVRQHINTNHNQEN